MLRLGFEYLASQGITELGRPILERVRDDTGYATSLVVRDGRDIVYIVRAAAHSPFASSVNVGTRLPAHATVLGHVLLCDLTLSQLRALYPEPKLEAMNPNTPATTDALFDVAQQARLRGHVMAEGFFEPHISTVAAPVFGDSGHVVAAIGLTVPGGKIAEDQRAALVAQVRGAATQLSTLLNYDHDEPQDNVVPVAAAPRTAARKARPHDHDRPLQVHRRRHRRQLGHRPGHRATVPARRRRGGDLRPRRVAAERARRRCCASSTRARACSRRPATCSTLRRCAPLRKQRNCASAAATSSSTTPGQGRVSTFADTSDEAWTEELKLKFFSLIHPDARLRAAAGEEPAGRDRLRQLAARAAARAAHGRHLGRARRRAEPDALAGHRVRAQGHPRQRDPDRPGRVGPMAAPLRRARRQVGRTGTQWTAALAQKKGIQLGRLGKPEEAAQAIFHLATPASSYTTGSHIDVSGGLARHI